MINKILTKNNKILANVFFQTLTNQAHLNSCTALHTYIIELNIIHIVYNLIVQVVTRSHARDFNRRHAACKIALCNRGFIINYYTSRLYGGPLKNIPTRGSGAKWSPSKQP
jgi:hypothetical protein